MELFSLDRTFFLLGNFKNLFNNRMRYNIIKYNDKSGDFSDMKNIRTIDCSYFIIF